MTSYTIHGIEGFCGEEIVVKVWNNGTSFKCEKLKELKKSAIIYKALRHPEERTELLCGNCLEVKEETKKVE